MYCRYLQCAMLYGILVRCIGYWKYVNTAFRKDLFYIHARYCIDNEHVFDKLKRVSVLGFERRSNFSIHNPSQNNSNENNIFILYLITHSRVFMYN